MVFNVRDIRSFSEAERKKNLGEGRAEPRTVYPLLYAPTTERRRVQRGTKRSGVSSKNIFRSHSLDRLSLLIINLIFSVLKNERGVRGEFHFSKHLIIFSFLEFLLFLGLHQLLLNRSHSIIG